jgi:hypothetical protein
MTVPYTSVKKNPTSAVSNTAGTQLRMTVTSLIDAELAWVPRASDPAYVLPAVILEFLESVNWTGKSERRAECLYLQLSALFLLQIS